MSLSCSCDDYDGDGWYYFGPNDYSTLTRTKRVRCCSCKNLIDIGATCTKFERYRSPQNDIEERIHGDGGEIQLADKFMCEECSDLYFSLDALGFCYSLGQNVHELVKEYAETYQR